MARLKASSVLADNRAATRTSHFHAHSTYLRRLRLGVKMKMHVLTSALSQSRVALQMAESKRLILDGNVVIESQDGDAPIELWQQGDASMYTKDALQQRRLCVGTLP